MAIAANDTAFRTIERTVVHFLEANHVQVANCNGDWLVYDPDGGHDALFSATSLAIAIAEALRNG